MFQPVKASTYLHYRVELEKKNEEDARKLEEARFVSQHFLDSFLFFQQWHWYIIKINFLCWNIQVSYHRKTTDFVSWLNCLFSVLIKTKNTIMFEFIVFVQLILCTVDTVPANRETCALLLKARFQIIADHVLI